MSTGIIRDTFHFRQINVSKPMFKEAPIGTLDASSGPTMLIIVHIVRKLRWQRRGFSHFIILKIFHKHRNSFTILGLCRDIFLVPRAFPRSENRQRTKQFGILFQIHQGEPLEATKHQTRMLTGGVCSILPPWALLYLLPGPSVYRQRFSAACPLFS